MTNTKSVDQSQASDMLAKAHGTFRRWLGDEYDMDMLNVVLAAAAVERLDGDPLWPMIISGSGNAKTETVQALAGAGALVTSTINSEGALLSATAKKDRAEDATGGLLMRLGPRGVLVIKDFTSILSSNGKLRPAVLAALREVYDGRWERNVGSEGGKSLEWKGRIGLVAACTTAWDTARDVIAAMGDRFIVLRSDSTKGRLAAGRRAIENTGSEPQMRTELAEAVKEVVAAVNSEASPQLTAEEKEKILNAADLVARSRTGLERDYRQNVTDAHAPEMPTRVTKQLKQVMRGALAIGMTRESSMELALRCARDSIPPLLLAIMVAVRDTPHITVAKIADAIDRPWQTVSRNIQALQALGLVKLQTYGSLVCCVLSDDVDLSVLSTGS